jgi:phage terminase large subunit-like protein
MKLQEGLNPTAVLLDETHVQKDGSIYNGLKKNFPKRAEPVFISMTTAGIKYTWAEELHDKAVKVRDGIIDAPGFLPIIYAADLDGDDWDEEQWKMANPGWDYLNIELLRQEAADAKESSTGLSAFRRYHLNKWVGAKVQWLSDDLWMRGTAGEQVRIEDLKGRHCMVGTDFGSTRDTTAAVFVFPPVSKGERWKVLTRVYMPDDTLMKRADSDMPQFLDWKDDGYIITTPKPLQDYESIRADIEMIGRYCVIDTISYDAWNANETVQYLEAAGLKTMAYGLAPKYTNAPMDKIESLLHEDMIEHSGHPVLRWMCGNTEAEVNAAGLKRPNKSSEKANNDAMVAFIMAVGAWIILQAEPVKQAREIVVSIKRQ